MSLSDKESKCKIRPKPFGVRMGEMIKEQGRETDIPTQEDIVGFNKYNQNGDI